MIIVSYDRSALTLYVTGHAYTGQPGRDLVCAAATMLVCTLAADIERLAEVCPHSKKHIALEPGKAELSLSAPGAENTAAIVFDSLCSGFALLAERYPGAVRLLLLRS